MYRNEDHFSTLAQSTLLELIEKKINIEEDIPFLPQILRARTVERDIKKIFSYLDAYVWTFIDHGILSTIINLHGSDQLKEGLEKYVQDLCLFEQTDHSFSANGIMAW